MEIITPLVEKSVLENGCRLITMHTPGIPRVDLTAIIESGGGRDPKDLPGIAHALEHMAFKGPSNKSAEDFVKAVEVTGGHMNAHTDNEETVYEISVPSTSLDIGVQSLADLVLHPGLDNADWEKERQVIIEEIGRRHDDPSSRLFDFALKNYWGEHPLAQSIAGSKESLEKITVDDIKNFHQKYYSPAHMILAVSSPFTHQEIRNKIEYQGFTAKPSTKKAPHLSRATPLLTPQTWHVETPSQQLVTIFLRTGPSSIDIAARQALQPIHDYLSRGQSSRLFQEARSKLGVAYDVSGFNHSYRRNGLIGAFASTTAPKLAAFEDVVRREFNAISQKGLPKGKLEEIKATIKGEVMMKAHLMRQHLQIAIRKEKFGGPQTLAEAVKALDDLTEDQVNQAAAKWYTADNLTRVTLGSGTIPEIKPNKSAISR